MISIIDYGAGNLHSVKKAFDWLGFETRIISDPADLLYATHIVLPGVGAFGDAIDHLRKNNMAGAVLQAIRANKNFLGVCLGMQLLFESSTEGGMENEGLGVFPEKIIKLPESVVVPHMGWNNIEGDDDIIFDKNPCDNYMYFVHSYVSPASDRLNAYTAATCDYGIKFAAAVRLGNCIGVQFHPEKSGAAGLGIYKRFGEMDVC